MELTDLTLEAETYNYILIKTYHVKIFNGKAFDIRFDGGSENSYMICNLIHMHTEGTSIVSVKKRQYQEILILFHDGGL